MKRNYTVDLLKLSCMLMVVLLHATNYGLRDMNIVPMGAIDIIVVFIKSFSIVAVDCFVLITGYYSSGLTKVNYRKLVSLWLQVFEYSLGVYLALVYFTNAVEFDVKILIKKALPLFTGQYWFFTVYILLILISPYINAMLSGIGRQTYIELLVLCGILFSLIPSVNIFGDTFGTEYGYSLTWFAVLYLSAAYLRRFGIKKRNYGFCYLILGITIFGIQLLMRYTQSRECFGEIATLLNLQVQYNSPLVFAAAVCLFMSAISHPLNLNGFEKIFGKIASLSFAVYLFHENGSIRDILWNQWVCLKNEGNSAIHFTLRLVVSTLLIFAVGILIEWMRRVIIRLLNNIFMRCTNKNMSCN